MLAWGELALGWIPALRRRDFLKGVGTLGACAGLPTVLPAALLPGSLWTEEPDSASRAGALYGVGNWSSDAFDPLGNHRVVLRVVRAADAVWVRIPWRRRDHNPQAKEMILVGAQRQAPVANVVRIEVNREFGELVFEPQDGAGEYFLYTLPTKGPGRSENYPVMTYPAPAETADPEWLRRNRLMEGDAGGRDWRRFPRAQVVQLQSVDSLNSFYPMGVIATAAETEAVLRAHGQEPLLVFPEERGLSIRMVDDLPERWVQTGVEPGRRRRFRANVDRNEYFCMQLGAYAAQGALGDVENISVHFGRFRSRTGATLALRDWTCFNLGGVNAAGQAFTHKLGVAKGQIQPLWLGVQVPADALPGEYDGTILVSAGGSAGLQGSGVAAVQVEVRFTVAGRLLQDQGDSDPYRLARLRWLNSRLGADDSVVRPFVPVTLSGNTVSILGRTVTVGPNGLPAQIESFFAPTNTHLVEQPRRLLSAPFSLVVEAQGLGSWQHGELQFEPHAPGRVDWTVTSTSGELTMRVHASMEFDGHIGFTVALTSSATVAVDDIRLQVPLARDGAVYMMGMGQKGGYRPASFAWKWDAAKNQDAVWVGDVHAGVQVSLRDERYARPLNTNFYHLKPLMMPASWENAGRGGCRIADVDAGTTLLSCYSGARTMQPGQTLYYNFELLLTPFKPIDTAAHWRDRYFHKGQPTAAEVKAAGANVINIHHGTAINPYLNYPFLRQESMKTYVDEAHELGMKVKMYYTVRELSDHAPEMFALRSLGHEVFVPGPGGGYSWLQEQLGSDYIAGWCVPSQLDATIINNGASRWHNYYVEGVAYLAKNVGIDGLYLDDLAFDRSTMQRVRRVLDSHRPGGLIDLHSANQYDERDGFASSANLYMGELPYIDRLWFGEYFDYNAAPDYYLIEISGIAFGPMSEMLQGGGNPWRGMLYGMTTRLGASGDPRPLWKLWDEFGMGESRMVGYWAADTPVTTGKTNILATCYLRPDAVLVALASWAAEEESVQLHIDWEKLGMAQEHAMLHAPAIEAFQAEARYGPQDAIPIPAGRGLLLLLQAASATV